MRILYYNWVDYLDEEKRGGGVTIYQRNLLQHLDAEGDVQEVFLSSGLSYDLPLKGPRWCQVAHGPQDDRDRRFEIVNSGTLSPAHHSFGHPQQLEHDPTQEVFFDFIAQHGPFDVVHFNNLEGLPATVLSLKKRWPQTKVVLSLHNYYPVCPQVNLWHQETEACTDFAGGSKCADCLLHKHDARALKLANGLAFRLKSAGIRPGTRLFDMIFRPTLKVGGKVARMISAAKRKLKPAPAPAALGAPAPQAENPFAKRRAGMIDLINTHCDHVLCVSDRVGEVAISYGITPDLVQTSYIGTREADKFTQTQPRPAMLGTDGTLTLAYLGYMRRDKGFFFLMDALDSLPDDLAGRVHLLAAARKDNTGGMVRLDALRGKLASVTHVDGYSHDALDQMLSGVDVGLVPVLWEDNLPQVAIEMHARHIPLLTSDMGGAQELARCPQMVFKAGDTDAFHARIRALLEGEITPERYWQNAMAPVSMETHVAELRGIYAG